MRNHLTIVAIAVALATSALASGCKDIIDGIGGDSKACEATADCGDGTVCINGSCGTPGSVGIGGGCSATRDCGDGLYCSAIGICAEGGGGAVGDTCSLDGDCTPGLRCELIGFVGTCQMGGSAEVGATCQANIDCLAGLFCAPDGTCKGLLEGFPPFTGVTCEPSTGAFRPYFEVPATGTALPDFFRLPFPNDARVSETGELDMTGFPDPGPTPLGVNLVKLYVDALVADFEGFGSTSAIHFRFAGDLDFATASGDTVLMFDVTAGATRGQDLARSWSYGSDAKKYICQNRFTVRNEIASPLLPGHTYAVVLKQGLKSKAGDLAIADADLAAVLAPTMPADARLARAWAAYAPLRDTLAMKSLTADDVVGATVFTVQDTTGHVARLATSVKAQPAPVLSEVVLCDGMTVSPCDDGTPARACPASPDADYFEVHGKLTVPVYQEGQAPYLVGGGNIVEDAQGVPQVQRTETVCFSMSIPKNVAPPASGWPLVVYGHGTGGSMRSYVNDELATRLATGAAPAVVLGFDMVQHGARRGGSMIDPDQLVFNPLNPRASRDNLLQGAVDILQAFRVASLPDFTVTGVGTVDLNPAQVAYYGHSQGSSSGELAVAFATEPKAAVFSGAGAFLTASLLNKSSPVDIATGMQFLLGEALGADHPIMTLFQTYFERSDAVNYTPLVLRAPPVGVSAKHVHMTYGTSDTFTPRQTLQLNALGLGVPVAGAPLPDEGFNAPLVNRPVSQNLMTPSGKRTAACYQYAASGYDGHFVNSRDAQALSDWTAFLSSFFATGTPTVP